MLQHLYPLQLLSLLLPAILNSGLVQIASLTDLYFSSFVPGAAAGLSCKLLSVLMSLVRSSFRSCILISYS